MPSVSDIAHGFTAWQAIGLLGTILFGGRWVVQAFVSARAGRSITPKYFWYMSMAGNLLILSYFVFGSYDLVGVVSNAFPILVSGYNLFLICKQEKRPL